MVAVKTRGLPLVWTAPLLRFRGTVAGIHCTCVRLSLQTVSVQSFVLT